MLKTLGRGVPQHDCFISWIKTYFNEAENESYLASETVNEFYIPSQL